jgi:hypothetical protein
MGKVGRIYMGKTGMAEREGVNQPSKINALNWLTLNFGPTVL